MEFININTKAFCTFAKYMFFNFEWFLGGYFYNISLEVKTAYGYLK